MDPRLREDDGRGGDSTFATPLKAGVSHGSEPSQGRWLVFPTIPPYQEELFFSLVMFCALWFKIVRCLKAHVWLGFHP